jgi:membrane protease YdiL (CAAX protease family)
MLERHYRAVKALLVFVAWLLITSLFGKFWKSDPGLQSLFEFVEPGYVAAIVFLMATIALFRWHDLGLNPPPSTRSLLLLWFPGLYVLVFLAALVVVGPPGPAALGAILGNAFLAGISEELACRGVLYQGLRSRLSVWPAILLSTALFAAGHLVNGFVFGSFTLAAVQALTAFMTGIAFMAIRIRTGSLYPGMVLHGLWDFSLLAVTSRALDAALKDGGLATGMTAGVLLLPILGVLPNFLYGLFLLRHVTRDADPPPSVL